MCSCISRNNNKTQIAIAQTTHNQHTIARTAIGLLIECSIIWPDFQPAYSSSVSSSTKRQCTVTYIRSE